MTSMFVNKKHRYSRKTKGDLQIYRIPKDINRRRVWLKRIRRKNFMPTENIKNTRLCSVHFLGGQKSDDIDSVSYNPSIFVGTSLRRREIATMSSTV